MVLNLRKKLNDLIKPRAVEMAYRVLMRPARHFKGRRLFGVEELRLVHQALLSQNLFGIDGKMVPQFEKEFAFAYGVPYAVASTSGTAAIHTALGALDLHPGDEIITAPITDMGTIIPILYERCVPVFADVDETCNMDPADVERKITPRTKAIVVVHLFGNPCDMDAMVGIARKHGLVLIEDCAQAHMTEYKGRLVGTIGDIGCFSFQQSKHMTTGDGGMTITSNKDYYEKMRLFVDKGYARKGWGSRAYLFLAPNYRMNELTAAVGLAQLKKVRAVVQRRHALGAHFTQLLSNIPGVAPVPLTKGAESSYWMVPVYLKGADVQAVAEAMRRRGVWVSAGYTVKPIYGCSATLAAKEEYREGLCHRAEEGLRRLICIPLDESWTNERVEKVCRVLAECVVESGVTNGHCDPERSEGEAISFARGDCFALRARNDSGRGGARNDVMPRRPKADEAISKVRIGIVGCGQMGRWHLDAYRKNPRVELVAFADSDLSRAQAFAREVGGRTYASHREMIEAERLDGVSLCTVPASHHPIALDLLDAGLHVLCEKPLAISVAQAEEMVRRAQERNRLLLPAFKFRFFEEVQRAKDLLGQNGFGRILNFRLMFGGAIDMKGSWYADREVSGGGVLMDNGPHAFDLVRYLLGGIQTVAAEVSACQNLPVEDTAHLLCVLENGVKGFIDLSWTTSIPSAAYLEIYGENGCLLLDLNGLSYKFKAWDEFKRVPNAAGMKAAFARQIDHFVHAMAGEAPSIVRNDDGYQTQTHIEQAYASLNDKNGAARV